MQIECLFRHFSAQYEFGLWNENVWRVKGGYFKKLRLTNCAKNSKWVWSGNTTMITNRRQNANFENRGTTILIGILHVLINFCQYLYCLGYMKRLAFSEQALYHYHWATTSNLGRAWWLTPAAAGALLFKPRRGRTCKTNPVESAATPCCPSSVPQH